MRSSGTADVLPRRRPPAQSVLARHWYAWVLSAIAVAVTQNVMWNGWNRSGEWVSVTGTTALFSYALYGLACAVPVVGALMLFRRWLSLAVVLSALIGLGVSTGHFFETSQSSTAGFAWFAPLVYGVPFVAAVGLTELFTAWLLSRTYLRRRS